MFKVGDYVIREHSSGKCYGYVAIIQDDGKLKVRPDAEYKSLAGRDGLTWPSKPNQWERVSDYKKRKEASAALNLAAKEERVAKKLKQQVWLCLLYTSPSPRD